MDGSEPIQHDVGAKSRSYRFAQEKRIRKNAEFSAVYAKGRLWSHPVLRLRVLPNQREYSRFGFVVGKRLGNAVVRNRLKRRLREAVRKISVRPGYDLVIMGRTNCAGETYDTLQRALRELFLRARLLPVPER